MAQTTVALELSTRPRVGSLLWRAWREPITKGRSLDPTIDVRSPEPIDQVHVSNDTSDYMWYSAEISFATSGKRTLELSTGVANAFLVFLDGTFVGADADYSHTGMHGATRMDPRANLSFPIKSAAGKHRLDLLSVSMGLNNWLGVEDNWKGLLAPNGKLQFVESGTGTLQDITRPAAGWLMQPRLQGERLRLPDGKHAQPVAWTPAGPSTVNQSMTWLQAEFSTPPGASALVLDAGGLGRGHAYVNGFDIGRYYLITGTPCSQCKCGGRDSCCDKSRCGKPSQQVYHIPPDVLKPVGGEANTITLIEELGATDLSSVHVRRWNASEALLDVRVARAKTDDDVAYCDVDDFGAVADDGLSDTDAIRVALKACGGPGGGEIVLKGPGVYESAPMNLTSNQVLHVGTGAILRAPMVNKTGHCYDNHAPCPYAVMDRFPSYQMSRSGFGCRLGPFIGAFRQHNITITGGGTIDGNGQWFWEPAQMAGLKIERPRLVELQFVQRLRIGPIVLRNSPYWTLHPIYCNDVVIRDILITADDGKGGWGYNTDGIDPDSCKNVLIENYVYSAGDDAIAVKSGWNYAGYTFNMSSENITARNCSSNGRGGYTIGSEMSGGVRNVTFEDSTSTGIAGIRISSQPGRGLCKGRHISTAALRVEGKGIWEPASRKQADIESDDGPLQHSATLALPLPRESGLPPRQQEHERC